MPTEASADLVKASLAATLSWRADAGRNSWKRIPVKYELRGLEKFPGLHSSQDWRGDQMVPGGGSAKAAPKDSTIN